MKVLFILNGAPYGEERTYNGLRLAGALVKRDGIQVRVFLMGDAAISAKNGQKVPAGFYNVQVMLNRISNSAPESVGVCGTCLDARGIKDEELMDGTHRGTLEELADWSIWAEQILVF